MNQLLARSENVHAWEKFQLAHISHEHYVLKSVANGKHIKVDLNNGGILKASSNSISSLEAFILTKINKLLQRNRQEEMKQILREGNYYLIAAANHQVVCAEECGTAAISALEQLMVEDRENFMLLVMMTDLYLYSPR